MNELITDIVTLQPTFKEYPWMNETAWMSMLESVGKRLSDQYMSWEFHVQR